jgi:DNA polymerase
MKWKKVNELAVEKFANTPEHCFIYNDSVNGKKVPNKLDKKWYIELAEKRLKQFGM